MNKLTSAVKVLVVDDQPLIVEELCEFLESSGYRCVPCGSSRQALQRFSEDAEIGLVLCDLHMPDMDGIELVQTMQKVAGKARAFEAIMLTGRADKQDVIKALRTGSRITTRSRSISTNCLKVSSVRKRHWKSGRKSCNWGT